MKQVELLRKSNLQVYKKLLIILAELEQDPYAAGTGQPKQMKYIQGMWSRRLDKKNRIRYTIDDGIVTVFIVSVLGHYDDK
jgi:toxin YoeB